MKREELEERGVRPGLIEEGISGRDREIVNRDEYIYIYIHILIIIHIKKS